MDKRIIMGKQWTQITEKEFNRTKDLNKLGLDKKQISEITGRNSARINIMLQHENMQDYKTAVVKSRARYATPKTATIKVADKPDQTPQATPKKVDGVPELTTAVNNLTSVLITLVSVLDDKTTSAAINKSKSFWKG
jgi:hypothetical protein